MTKTLMKVILRRSHFETKCLKTKTQPSSNFTKSRKTFAVSYAKGKEENIIGKKNLLDHKELWKTMKTFLSGKNTIFPQITIEKNKIISNDLSRDFSTSFENAVRSLNVR